VCVCVCVCVFCRKMTLEFHKYSLTWGTLTGSLSINKGLKEAYVRQGSYQCGVFSSRTCMSCPFHIKSRGTVVEALTSS